MNIDIVMEIIGEVYDAKRIIGIAQTDNNLASVLASHLTLERFLEAWICGSVQHPKLFSKPTDTKKEVQFGMAFGAKAKLCQKLGMPIDAFRAIDKLNDIRNDYAHKYDHTGPDANQINAIASLCKKFEPESSFSILDKEYKLWVLLDSGEERTYAFHSKSTPIGIKYMALVFHVIKNCLAYMVSNLPITRSKNTKNTVKMTPISYSYSSKSVSDPSK